MTETVPVDKPPRHFLGNLLSEGPDGQCSYYYNGIDERCTNDVDAHTLVEHGGEPVRVEMCAEHAREDVPSREEWEQEVLA
jgi:hypothetical protein